MTFEYINVITKNEEKKCNIISDHNTTLYIDEKLYRNDIGFKDYQSAMHQTKIDIPRCIFVHNGNRCTEIENIELSKDIIWYCNQAVMGFPVQILFENIGEVMESGFPLYISVSSDGCVNILKCLKVISDNIVKNVIVTIFRNRNQLIELKFFFNRNE